MWPNSTYFSEFAANVDNVLLQDFVARCWTPPTVQNTNPNFSAKIATPANTDLRDTVLVAEPVA